MTHLLLPQLGGARLLTGVAAIVVGIGHAHPLAAQNTPPPPVPEGENRRGPVATTPTDLSADEAPIDPLHPEQLKRYSIDRYEKIIEKSPFAYKIVREEGPPPISFATDLALAGYTVDAGKQITYASIIDKKSNNRIVIRTDRPTDGIQLVQLNRGPTLLESSVLARKGNEEALIQADKQIIERKAVVNAAVVGQPMQNMGGRGGPQGNNLNLNLNPNPNNRAAAVQAQINNQLQQPPQPGGAPGGVPAQGGGQQQGGVQPGGLPPGAVPANTVRGNAPGAAPPTAGDLSIQAAQPQQIQRGPQGRGGQEGRGQQAPGRRRVILPPSP